jgi:hypothetical protein
MYRFNGPCCVQEISLRLPPATLEDVVGRATVLQEFLINVSKKRQVSDLY